MLAAGHFFNVSYLLNVTVCHCVYYYIALVGNSSGMESVCVCAYRALHLNLYNKWCILYHILSGLLK